MTTEEKVNVLWKIHIYYGPLVLIVLLLLVCYLCGRKYKK